MQLKLSSSFLNNSTNASTKANHKPPKKNVSAPLINKQQLEWQKWCFVEIVKSKWKSVIVKLLCIISMSTKCFPWPIILLYKISKLNALIKSILKQELILFSMWLKANFAFSLNRSSGFPSLKSVSVKLPVKNPIYALVTYHKNPYPSV